MNPLFRNVACLLLLTFLSLSGCSKKLDVKTQAAELGKAFPGAVTPAPQAQTEGTAAQTQTAPDDANAYVSAALSSIQNNDYAQSVITLQKAEATPGLSYAQFLAIDRAKQAMNIDLIQRADRGDAKAKADLAKIEKTLSQ